MGDRPALYLATDYWPGACSLADAHLRQKRGVAAPALPTHVSEDQLWSYACQVRGGGGGGSGGPAVCVRVA